MDRKALTAALQSRDKTYVFLWTHSQFKVAELKRLIFLWLFLMFIHDIACTYYNNYNAFHCLAAGAERVGRC